MSPYWNLLFVTLKKNQSNKVAPISVGYLHKREREKWACNNNTRGSFSNNQKIGGVYVFSRVLMPSDDAYKNKKKKIQRQVYEAPYDEDLRPT